MIQPLSALRAYRRIKRYRQVTFTLAKYGFGDISERVGLGSLRSRLKGTAHTVTVTPQRIRMALVDLGPTFVKFGQLLSTRPDIVPERYIQELEKLQDEVLPFDFAEVRKTFEDELGALPEDLFQEFSEPVLASGSIAQVHKARLPSGEWVAVKVRRPGIRRLIETDLAILFDFAALVERHIPEWRWLQPVNLVDQFARTIRRELDFQAEGQAIERFRRHFEGDPTRFIPRVHWSVTSERILTTDLVVGVKVTDIKELEARGFDKREVARNGARSILKEVFQFRLFHADPHPGNFFVIEGNAIAAVDYGIVGRIDEETAEQLALLLSAFVQRDSDGVLRVFRSLGLLRDEIDVALLKFDIEEFIDRYYGLSLARLNAERVISDLLQLVRRHRIILPINLALLGRMLAVASGVGRTLDPGFNIVDEATPFLKSFLASRADPRRLAGRALKTWGSYQRMIGALPGDIEEIVSQVKKGQLTVSLHHEGLTRFILEMDRSSNRLAFAVVVAALVIGSSLMINLGRGPALFGFSLLGLIGYLVAGLLGLWLVIAIIKSGRI